MKTVNHESYVSFEIAKLLKELGFDLECRCYYETSGKLRGKNSGNFIDYNSPLIWQNNGNTDTQLYSAPTFEVVQRWLREAKGLFICVIPEIKDYRATWNFYICNEQGLFYENGDCFSTYEETQEVGINKVLEIILEEGL